MLDVKTIDVLLQFLGRATLAGNEVPAFVQATNALHQTRQELVDQPAPGVAEASIPAE